MSAPPPPPPPSFNIGSSAASSDSGKSLLLQSIRNGKQLKKTVTIDKSAPCIAGKVRNGNINGGNNNNSNNNSSPTPLTKNTINNNGNGSSPINLGGLFAGGMPKLKPTGLRSTIVDKESSPSPPSTGNLSSYSHTIKRGPPPVPPPATQKPQIINEINVNESSKGFGKPMLAPKPPAPSITTTTTTPPPPPIATSTTTTTSSPLPPPPSTTTTTLSTPPSKPYPPPKNLDIIRGGSVSRAQSMRLPRSPPVLAPSPSSLHQSQDFLNETQHRLTNRILKPPVVRPPSPPISRSSSSSLNTSSTTRSAPPPPTRVAVPTMPPPPPPPPHRSNTGHQRHAPPPPTRNLSLVNDQTNNQTSYITNDFEQRFVKLFHSISTFPNPEQFRGVPKLYNSKNAAKQQAPAPPPPPPQQQQSSTSSSSMIQLNASSGVKQWQHNAASSAC